MAAKNDIERWRGETTQKLDDLKDTVNTRSDRLEQALAQHAAEDDREFTDAKKRLSALEMAQATFTGKLAVFAITVLFSTAVAAMMKHLWP